MSADHAHHDGLDHAAHGVFFILRIERLMGQLLLCRRMALPAGGVFAAACVAGMLVAEPGRAQAQLSEPVARGVVGKGAVEAGLLGGFYQATTLIGDADSDNRSAFYALPQIGLVLTDEFEAGDWSGNVTVLLEPLLAHYFEPFSASAL